MGRLIFELPPLFILLCFALGMGYSWLLYSNKQPWNKTVNWILFAGRTILVFFISALLLGPIIKQIKNIFEKPAFVVLQDNSISIKEATDSITLKSLSTRLMDLRENLSEHGYTVTSKNLEGDEVHDAITYTMPTSDLQGALRKIANEFEGKSLAGVVLVSDGIYNTGVSPLYTNYSFPVHSVGVGDSTQRQDLSIKNLLYNRIAYQGNKFTLRAEILAKGFNNQNISISLLQSDKVIERQTINSGNEQLLIVDFTTTATEQGIQRFDVQVVVKPEERNSRNNRSTAFIEVVEGKKKILVVASAPHPDIKALRSVIEKNSNYEFVLHIPGVHEAEPINLQPQNIDLAIFHQAPDKRGRTQALFERFTNDKTSLLVVVGPQSELAQLSRNSIPLKVEQLPRQFDDVMPVLNPAFANFSITPEANAVFAGFPPVWVPFGKMIVPPTTVTLLFQKVGSQVTDKPLLWVDNTNNRKIAIMLGEGFWKWRLQEFSKQENTLGFDEVMGKLIQLLSTTDDKSKFRSYPIRQQFSDTEAVVFESQVYNDIYEPVYGSQVDLEITNEAGKKFSYNYVTSLGNEHYQIGGLAEGVYRYTCSTQVNEKKVEVKGQFLVNAQEAELQSLTADFNLLRKLSITTGGKFYNSAELETLKEDLLEKDAQSIIHSEETYDKLLNLKSLFFTLLLLVSAEWFLRRYFGSY